MACGVARVGNLLSMKIRSLFKQVGVSLFCAAIVLALAGCRSAASKAAREQQRNTEQAAKIAEKDRRVAEKEQRAVDKQKRLQESQASLSDEQLRFKFAGLEQAIARGTEGMNILLASGNGSGALIAQGQIEAKVKERDAVGMELARRATTARSAPPTAKPEGDDSTTLKGTGSGFFVSEDGFLVTNFHVVKDARRIEVKYRGQSYDAQVVRRDIGADLAVLRLVGKFTALPFGSSRSVKLGERVFTMGFPKTLIQGVEPKFTEGSISSLFGYQDDAGCFQISAPVQQGNSGGPLVNGAGQIVGIIVAGIPGLQNVNYAIKSSRAHSLFDDVPELKIQLSEPTATLAPPEIAERLQQAVALVLIY